MKLQERLPDSIRIGRKRVRLDLDFRNVLRMMETLARNDLTAAAREYLALKCVCRRVPRDTGAAIAAVKGMLFPDTKKPAPKEKITDFEQDADLIRAAFLQAYGINLWRERLHWLEFAGLLHAIPEGNRYSEVIGIRVRPMPAPTKYNAEERQWLAKAKAECAVRLTDAEQEKGLKDGLRRVAESLIALAEAGGKNG